MWVTSSQWTFPSTEAEYVGGFAHQELGGAEDVQSEGLDPGVMDTQLPVDP